MILIVFSGLDGCGKTTFSQELTRFMRLQGLRVCRFEIYKQSMYLNVGKALEAISPQIKSRAEIMQRSISGAQRGFFILLRRFFFLLDIFVYQLRLLFTGLFKDAIVCDRYFYDLLVHYLYLGVIREDEVVKFLGLFTQPDLVFFLDAQERLAFQREAAHSDIEYFSKKRRIYEQMKRYISVYSVSSSDSLTQTFTEILTQAKPVFDKLQIRVDYAPPFSKHILLVSRSVEPPWDEASKNLVRDIASRIGGFTFHILSSHGKPLRGQVISEPIYKSARLSVAEKIRLLAFLARRRNVFDLYHFCFTPEFFTAFLLKILVKREKSIQSIPYLSGRISGNRMQGIIFADSVILNSRFSYNALKRYAFKNIHLVYPSVDTGRFSPDLDALKAKKSFGLDQGCWVLWAGKFLSNSENEAISTIIQEVTVTSDDINFVIASRFLSAACERRARRLQAMLKAKSISQRVVFNSSVQDMALLLAACDVVIYPFFKGFVKKIDIPYVIIESMASGKPLVLSDVSPINEVIEMGAGVGVKGDNPKVFSSKIIALLRDRSLCQEAGRKNREIALRYFNLDTNINQFRAIYQSQKN